jgi:hypothetical protein
MEKLEQLSTGRDGETASTPELVHAVFRKLVKDILSQVGSIAMPPAVLDQVRNTVVTTVQVTEGGGFADLTSDCAASVVDENGEESFALMYTIHAPDEAGNAILHFRDCRAEYLEIWLYDPAAKVEDLVGATLE